MSRATAFIEQPYTFHIVADLTAPRPVIWRFWTDAQLLKRWFCPEPWKVAAATIEPHPGGAFDTVFEGPNGERADNKGQFIEVEAGLWLVFGNAPGDGGSPVQMTSFVELIDTEMGGTKMIWGAVHADEAAMQAHLDMGMEAGWKTAAAQLDALSAGMMP